MSAAKVVPPFERKSIVGFLKTHLNPWSCSEDSKGKWLDTLDYTALPLSPSYRVVYVTAGPGCARGGQGSNGAMWLFRFQGRRPVLLTPQKEFSGFLFSIEPVRSHGFRDLVVGWHVSASETGLAYFRFDGNSYRSIGSATRLSDESGEKIIPR